MKKTLSHIIPPLLCALVGTAYAQAVYRCGNSYSQHPCPGGTAVQTADERTPEQRMTHERQVRQDARTADTMEKNRLKQEAVAARNAEQQAKAEQQAARKAQPPKAAHDQSGKKLPAYRAPVTPKPQAPR